MMNRTPPKLLLEQGLDQFGVVLLLILLVTCPQGAIAQFVRISAEIELTSYRTGQTNAPSRSVLVTVPTLR